MKILVAGYSIRHIACSAARAGHEVIAADCFCDLDLERCISQCIQIEQPDTPHQAERLLRSLVEKHPVDAVVLGPGLEETPVEGAKLLNNPQDKAAKVSDKFWLADWLEGKGFPFIPTLSLSDGSIFNYSLKYPLVLKPRKGAGGVGCRLIKSKAEIENIDKLKEDLIIQSWVMGKPASVSVIADGKEAVAIAANEQIIGEPFTGAQGFRYCGNITPLEPERPDLYAMAEEIISELGLVGSNGIDFLITEDGPVVVEVNPRFQGSLDAIELSTGLNIFNAHLNSFKGQLPMKPMPSIKACRSAGRAIIYADRDIKVQGLLQDDWITDIPRPDSIIKKDDPVASILACGQSRNDVMDKLVGRAKELREKIGS